MKETSARLLRLLTLLQSHREWSGQELADRLAVSTRTVRRDVDKLRDLDYPVNAVKGIDGGYRLGAGARLPPLLLDDEEAVAIAVALRTATGSGVAGIGEIALRALVKLEQVLPARLRHRVDALQVSTVRAPTAAPTVDAEVLTTVGTACRDHRQLRFDYLGHDGDATTRTTEPHELVTWGPRWYLVAWDLERDDWRTFRVDRISPRTPTGPRFTPREVPGGDAAAHVARGVARMWPYRATIRLHTPAHSSTARSAATYGTVEPVDEHSCLLHIGADSPRALAFILGALDIDFHIEDAPELAEHLRRTADRYRRATAAPETP
ncbi:putative DNA-binding transcriptional regulator YafY [Kitasatospora sp. MAA4]|uniref:helix-turn-helix transcriptional regulator n=1 Tax=Kitasatospora sp. MAA4 TaxID=3035093 RepID=UPI00247396A2|nr:YafY family protein [Kitasatospora sp. MAA4]MDH6132744.1 putative DNA-binding transcriptional regulator YafY [Kitasatospora sp. MAA4]